MNPTQLSSFTWKEFLDQGLTLPAYRKTDFVRVYPPADQKFRFVYLFLEALTSVAGADFQLRADIEFRRNQSLVASMPASIGTNAATYGTSVITAWGNAAGGTENDLLVTIGPVLTGGSVNAVLTPQRVQLECDDISLNIIDGNVAAAGTFSSIRAILAVRSSIDPL